MEVATKQKAKTPVSEKPAKMEPPSLRCVLCDAIIYFRKGSQERFENHMRNEHEVATKEMGFLLAMHFTNQEERRIWKQAMEDRIPGQDLASVPGDCSTISKVRGITPTSLAYSGFGGVPPLPQI